MTETARLDRDLFPLTAFLASAARSGLEEGVFTATFRLVDTISRLLEVFPVLRETPFFAETGAFLEENKSRAYLMSEEEYEKFLDELLARFARETARRHGIAIEAE